MRTPVGLSFISVGVALVSAAIATPGCTHTVRRAALVPHQQAIGHSGSQAQTTEISVGTPNLVTSGEPRVAAGENAGIVIPRWQGQGGLRVPWGRSSTIGFHAEYGLDEGSKALADDQPDPKGDIMGAAVSLFYSAYLSPKFDLGVGGQLWFYSIPYAEYETCVNCPSPYTNVEHDRDIIPVLSLGILPTYKVGPGVSIFGGFNIRNHPTIEKSDITLGLDSDEEVEAGPPNAIGSIGADVLITERIKLTGYLHRPISGRPVIYGLTAGLMVTFIAPPQTATQPATYVQ